MTYCFGDIVIKTGKFYFTLLVDPLFCCVEAGAYNAYESSVKSMYVFSIKPIFCDAGFGIGKKSFELGVLIDMDRKRVVVADHREKKIGKVVKFDHSAMSPCVHFKHEVSITISQSELPVPDWLKDYPEPPKPEDKDNDKHKI